jgi:hypothetical protein
MPKNIHIIFQILYIMGQIITMCDYRRCMDWWMDLLTIYRS